MSSPLTLTTQTDDRPRSDAPSPFARIYVLCSAGRVLDDQRLLAPGDSVTIGRDPGGNAALRLPEDRKLSRCHARVDFDPHRGMLVQDLGSKNGLSLNGYPLTASTTVLSDGDVLRLGSSLLLVRCDQLTANLASADCLALHHVLRGPSQAMVRLRSTLARVAKHQATVLLLGATGTGKEVAARAIHDLSDRGGHFIAVNCTTLSASLAESQLFGHNKGAFTGANEQRPGYFREAQGGTLFLDEIGDLPLDLQPKLLRALQEKVVRPVGAATDVRVDVRIIAATNVDLRQASDNGQFRSDLLERLAVLPIALPRLSQRREDILPLFLHFLSLLSGSEMRASEPSHLPIDLAQRLVLHGWPRNVRELRNVCERLHTFCDGLQDLNDIPDDLLFPLRPPEPPEPLGPSLVTPRSPLASMTREEVTRLLEQHDWNIARAARTIGADRLRLYRLMRQHRIDRPSHPNA
jgi:DNA-binding NtrC family response regulator